MTYVVDAIKGAVISSVVHSTKENDNAVKDCQ